MLRRNCCLSRSLVTWSAISFSILFATGCQGLTKEDSSPDQANESVERDIPYSGAFGPDKPPKPMMPPTQTPLEPLGAGCARCLV